MVTPVDDVSPLTAAAANVVVIVRVEENPGKLVVEIGMKAELRMGRNPKTSVVAAAHDVEQVKIIFLVGTTVILPVGCWNDVSSTGNYLLVCLPPLSDDWRK